MSTRRRSRLLRLGKWIGLGACVLTLSACLISQWYYVWIAIPPRSFASIDSGCFGFGWRDEPAYSTSYTVMQRHAFSDKSINVPWVERNESVAYTQINVPFWAPLIALIASTVLLFHRDRRRIGPGFCTRCRYDLTGNTSGVCPECGMKLQGKNVAAGIDRASKATR